MKVVLISPLNPFPPQTGGERRIYSLAKYLSKRVELALVVPKEDKRGQQNFPVKVYHHVGRPRTQQLIDPRFFWRVAKVIKREKPDHLLLEFPWQGLHIFLLSRFFGIPFSVEEHNLEFERKRELGSSLWRFLKLVEVVTLKQAFKAFCVSQDDKEKIVQLGIEEENVLVAPNGVDPGIFGFSKEKRETWRQKLGMKKAQSALLFFGPYDYLPNRQAIQVIKREILPRLKKETDNFQVLVAGMGTAQEADTERVKFLGLIDDLPGLICAADVVLVPLETGGGSRLKILEAVASGIPVVSTSRGAAGLDHGLLEPNLVIINSWDEMVSKIFELVQKSEVPLKVPEKFWRVYSWESATEVIFAGLKLR
jgi:glycosyltransferase involved in cell wall biosynthesis